MPRLSQRQFSEAILGWARREHTAAGATPTFVEANAQNKALVMQQSRRASLVRASGPSSCLAAAVWLADRQTSRGPGFAPPPVDEWLMGPET